MDIQQSESAHVDLTHTNNVGNPLVTEPSVGPLSRSSCSRGACPNRRGGGGNATPAAKAFARHP
eukprot:9499630-Pyramimonas_sp.AAC.1